MLLLILPSESVKKCCLVYFIEWRKYIQWEKEVLSKAKLRTYHLFKREFITEQ